MRCGYDAALHAATACFPWLVQDFIGTIRANYTRDFDSTDIKTKQMATALYFLDKLALRAGHEKDEDEADTVGCCTLKARMPAVTWVLHSDCLTPAAPKQRCL